MFAGLQTAAVVAAFIEGSGRVSEINGVATWPNGSPLKAIWAECEVDRITRYISDESEARGAYMFGVVPAALDAPFNLSMGSIVKWPKRGWEAVVRRIDIEVEGQDASGVDIETGVSALVVLRQR